MVEFFLHYGFFATFAAYGAGALSALLFGLQNNDRVSSITAHACAALGGIFGLGFSMAVLFSGDTFGANIANIPLGGDALRVRIDSLAALFLGIISVVCIASSLFGIGYQKQFYGVYRLGHFGFFYNIFLAGMVLVISANDGILFLFAWELMAIASYFLVVFERREESNIRAGMLYILISQVGAAFLFAVFLILHRFTGSWDFDVIRATAGALPVVIQNTVLALALVGFASKAGVIPLHIWLPEAHPAAPSHVSALMSGVMIKTAIFMIVRFFVEFFPAHANWGMFIIALGSISAVLGILYALSERDVKRLLAFSSVENIGIILLGVGAAITFFSYDAPAFGIIALVAALYHAVNHALFKSLLFLSAGSVVHATHTRNMEEYGGLLKVMPWTGAFFLIGAAAISGLPPLNGFASEWFTFQGLLLGIATLPLVPKIVFLVGASSLAFTGGLAAACFVKAFGATFLARPRSPVHEHARESEPIMHVGMGLLTALIVLFGVGAGAVAPALAGVAGKTRGLFESGPLVLANPVEAIPLGDFSALSMSVIAIAILGGIFVAFFFTWSVSRKQKVTVSRTWDCGSPLGPRMEITATGFSKSILTVFRGLLRPSTQTHVEYEDASIRYFPKSKKVHFSLPDFYRVYLYFPTVLFVERAAREARRVQTGNLNTYLLYMFLTLIALLYWTLR